MKIAVLLPRTVDLPMLLRARALCRILVKTQPLTGSPIEIAVGLPETDEPEWRLRERFLSDGLDKVIVRHLRWESVPAANANRMFAKHGLRFDLDGIEWVQVPRDWGWNFSDCDVWINFADPSMGAVLPIKPVAHYVSDLAMRIVPYSYAAGISDPLWQFQADAFRLWRQGGIVAVPDACTAIDATGYAGVRRQNVVQVPSLLLEPQPAIGASAAQDKRQLVWLLSRTVRHDFQNAIRGLDLYLRESGLLVPVIACPNPAELNPADALPMFNTLDDAQRDLWNMLEKYRCNDAASLSRLLSRSGLLWSSEIAGGEGFAMTQAARHGLQFLGFDFELHRTLGASIGPSVSLYTQSSPAAIADALHALEQAMAPASAPAWPIVSEAAMVQQYGFLIDRLLERAHG